MAGGPGLCPVLFPKALSPRGHSPLPCPSPSPFQPHRLGSSALPNPAPQGPGPYPSWFYTTLTYLYSPTTRKRYQGGTFHTPRSCFNITQTRWLESLHQASSPTVQTGKLRPAPWISLHYHLSPGWCCDSCKLPP